MIKHQRRIKRLKLLTNIPSEEDERIKKLSQIEEEWNVRDYRATRRKGLRLSRKTITHSQLQY